MSLSKEQLEELENLAYKLVPIQIMAVILEVDELSFREELALKGSDAYNAYFRGYGKLLVEQRESIIRAAKNGSTPAQEMVAKMITAFDNELPIQ